MVWSRSYFFLYQWEENLHVAADLNSLQLLGKHKFSFFIESFFIAFAFNIKYFTTAVHFVLFLFSFSSLFWMDCQKFNNQRFTFSYQENVWPRFDSLLGHTKIYFLKNCCLSCYSRYVWHMTRLTHINQHSQHPKKYKKLPEPNARNSETSYVYR